MYFRDLRAAGRSSATLRGYGLDLLRWFRFLWAIGVAWDRATRTDARDFSCWLATVVKPAHGHRSAGTVNSVTGKPSPAPTYAAATRARTETVLRRFYDLHMETGMGPGVNPFPAPRRPTSERPRQSDATGRPRPGSMHTPR